MSNSSVYLNLLRSRSNKPVICGLLAGIFLSVIFMAVIRDLNSKLEVMTSSNSEYQRMTDRQSAKIRKLEHEMSVMTSSASQSKLEAGREKEKVAKDFAACRKEFRGASRELQNEIDAQIQLREEMSSCSSQKDRVVSQYSALLKVQFTPTTKSLRYIWDVKRNIIILLIHFGQISIDY